MGGKWKPELAAAAQKRWRERHPEQFKLIRAEQYRASRALLDALKDGPCTDCGGRFPPECMDWDHLRDKKFDLANANTRSPASILAEIAKCELVCANCHRIRTKGRR
jgi:hypothetical protein